MNLRLQVVAVILMLALSACGGAPATPAPGATAAAPAPAGTGTGDSTNTPAAPPTIVPTVAPSATATSAPAQPPAATVTVTAPATGKDGLTPIGQIVREFRENKPAATAKYDGRTLMVRGVVNRINEFAGAYKLYLLDPVDKEGLVA